MTGCGGPPRRVADWRIEAVSSCRCPGLDPGPSRARRVERSRVKPGTRCVRLAHPILECRADTHVGLMNNSRAVNLVPPSPSLRIDPGLLARFAAIVGAGNAITEPAEIAPYLSEERGLYQGRSPLVLRP